MNAKPRAPTICKRCKLNVQAKFRYQLTASEREKKIPYIHIHSFTRLLASVIMCV